ncbi:uncharacterized protein EAF01_007055 [Botrytis porri]|uniref:uncharacterized protein n=1 Tax=Botrytis porri TaxID=87229 RepID=UPI00190064AC|nr:uncharacterized protein EAF01_007055 [Botrytis porri]KAF7901756.1 hypothetical protein EAF01_007055 [Botrytis porri]
MTTQQVSKSTAPDEKINNTMENPHTLSTFSINQIMDFKLRDALSRSSVEMKELKGTLISIPQEVRDMIYSSPSQSNPRTSRFSLVRNHLWQYSEVRSRSFNPLYCSNSPGDWDFTDGVFDDGCLEDEEDAQNGILEPYIINFCPLTRYTNCERKTHQDKPLLCNTPNIEKVKTWNILLNSFERYICWHRQLSSNAFAEFCVSVHACPNICLNISIIPLDFHERQTQTESDNFGLEEGLINNLLPLKMMRNIKTLAIKCAKLSVIPDYCFERDHGSKLWPAYLGEPDLPSPELISEYVKLTSGTTPIIECVGLLGERLKEYFWLFHRAEFVVINREFPGLRRGIRVHDVSIRPPEDAGGGLVVQEDEQIFLDCGELIEAIEAIEDPSLERTESAEDVLLFKQYRGELLKVLEPEYQNIRACSIKFREFLRSESGPTGVFVIGPSRAVDLLDYWSRVTGAMEVLEEYEYSFLRGKAEKLKLSVAKKNNWFVLAYESLESSIVIEQIASAYERRMWKKLLFYYKIAIRRMEKHYLKLRWCRKDMFKWDVLDKSSDLDTHSDAVEAIAWPKLDSNAQHDREHIIDISGETSDEELKDFLYHGNSYHDDDDDDDNGRAR